MYLVANLINIYIQLRNYCYATDLNVKLNGCFFGLPRFLSVNLPANNYVEMTLWARAFIKNMAELQITYANNFAYDFAVSQVTSY